MRLLTPFLRTIARRKLDVLLAVVSYKPYVLRIVNYINLIFSA